MYSIEATGPALPIGLPVPGSLAGYAHGWFAFVIKDVILHLL